MFIKFKEINETKELQRLFVAEKFRVENAGNILFG